MAPGGTWSGAVRRVGAEIDRLGSTSVLLITTRSLSQERTQLEEAKTEIGHRLADVAPYAQQHVPDRTVLRCVEVARAVRCDGIVTLGEGSVIARGRGLRSHSRLTSSGWRISNVYESYSTGDNPTPTSANRRKGSPARRSTHYAFRS